MPLTAESEQANKYTTKKENTMAHRSYLYSTNNSLRKRRDLSEFNGGIPLIYLVLLGEEPELTPSFVFDCTTHFCITGNFSRGLKRYHRFLKYLEKLPQTDTEMLASWRAETDEFFTAHPDKKSVRFMLEPNEVLDSYSFEDIYEEQVKGLLEDIKEISEDIDLLCKEKPKDLFEKEKKKYWQWKLQKDINTLKPCWQEVCYYSFNHTKP